MQRTSWKVLFLVTAVVAVALAWGIVERAVAAIEDKHCCNPAHPENPPAPPGSATDCEYDTDDEKCVSKDGHCNTVARQTAVPGKCCTPLVEGNTCNDNNGSTLVTTFNGTWSCKGAENDPTDCSCQWSAVAGTDQDIRVTQCSGSTCPANPTCP